ncbi:hypothetical protein V8F33_010227 [Rhypophila sp. PSN 637]
MSGVKMVKSLSSAIATVTGKYGKVTVAYVAETDGWRRTMLSSQAQDEFVGAVEKEAKAGNFGPEVTTVALMEQPHQSENDQRTHWTAFEVKNNDLEQGTTRHLATK